MRQLLLLFGGILFFAACTKDSEEIRVIHYDDPSYQTLSQILDLPEDPYNYTLNLPAHLAPGSNGGLNVNSDIATLGRVLFYDKALSHNSKVSCASCHHQENGFADPKALSDGFDGKQTHRNSLALGATVSFKDTYGGGSSAVIGGGALFFWDERATSIAQQSRMTIQDPIEMGMDINDLAQRLEDTDYYPILWQQAFNRTDVRPDDITFALEQFLNSIGAFHTKFDAGLSETSIVEADFSNFTPQENQGKQLFLANCATCHGERLAATPVLVANNGLDLEYADRGVGARSGLNSDNGKFKVPQLRNIGVTAPYMHDGRFETLEDVVDFYSDGIQSHDNLHEALRLPDGSANPFNFSGAEKAALVAFLHTLTDHELATDVRFSDPFK